MYLMFADEADRERDRGQRFFVYGAVFIDAVHALALHADVEAARQRKGFRPTDSLKFADSTRPEALSRDHHREIKAEIMEIAHARGVKFCAYAMLHEMARDRTHEELVQWGANTLLGKFNEFCSLRPNGHGLAFFDRMPIAHEHRYLREKFTIGLTFPNGAERRLEKVIALASTCDGASHLASVADIVLGSFRYCVNEPDRDIAGRQMYPNIVRLMWKRDVNGRSVLREYGLVLRPQNIAAEQHRQEYAGLLARLEGYLAPAQ
jgi:hypothetical protein